MAWNPQHKQLSRERIVSSAARLFALHGFEQVSIDTIMNDAGMTRGAFYAHFSSKSELYDEAIIAAAHLAGESAQSIAPKHLGQMIERYLSKQHLDGEGVRCPLAFLVSDIVQREPQVRDTYTRVFKGLVDMMRKPDLEPAAARQHALQRTVMMIGGVAVARAISDETLAQEVLQACREAALALPGETDSS